MERVGSSGRRGGGRGGGGGRGRGGKGRGPSKWKMPASVATKQQAVLANVDQVTGERIPKSFVFSRGKLPSTLRHLQQDLRKLMLPYTALKLKEKKRNNLKDFINVASPLGVTHFLILSNPKSLPHLRFAKSPQGPTYTCQIKEYALAADIANSQKRPRCPAEIFKNSPLVVLSGFNGLGESFKSFVTFFRHLVPAIDTDTVKLATCQRILLLQYDKETELIDFRHYSIKLQPIGVSRKIRKLMQNNQVPDLRDLKDVSDFVTKWDPSIRSTWPKKEKEKRTINTVIVLFSPQGGRGRRPRTGELELEPQPVAGWGECRPRRGQGRAPSMARASSRRPHRGNGREHRPQRGGARGGHGASERRPQRGRARGGRAPASPGHATARASSRRARAPASPGLATARASKGVEALQAAARADGGAESEASAGHGGLPLRALTRPFSLFPFLPRQH